jgi:hypothetical protein
MKNPGRDEVENRLFIADDQSMTGVVPALIADHGVGMLRINVDDLALPFIAPLGPYNNDIRHELFSDNG